jgi:hypothetical protein
MIGEDRVEALLYLRQLDYLVEGLFGEPVDYTCDELGLFLALDQLH